MYMRTGSVVRPNSESTVDRPASASSTTSSSERRRCGFIHQQGLGIGALVDLDAHVVDHADDILDLFGVEHVIGQVIVDFGVGQVAALLAQNDQVFQAHAAGFSIDRLLNLHLLLVLLLASFPCHVP
jgi:hypothetical protein